jgi:hypothetical protein
VYFTITIVGTSMLLLSYYYYYSIEDVVSAAVVVESTVHIQDFDLDNSYFFTTIVSVKTYLI